MQKLGLAKAPVAPETGDGLPIVENGDGVIYRLVRGWDCKMPFADMFRDFLSNPSVQQAPAIMSELDLSWGTLSDVGAEALLACPALEKLKSLDLHHHYCSDEMMVQLRQAFPGVNVSDQEESDDGDRYVAVSE